MSFFLWVEDFENSPKITAQGVFGSVVTDDVFSDNKRQLKNNLKKHGVVIELSFQGGLSFIRDKLDTIDYVILDIDLPAYSEDDEINNDVLKLFSDFQDYKRIEDEAQDEALIAKNCEQLKSIAGFYLYTELVVELGFPKQHILFCSNHAENAKTTQDAFKTAKIALPRIYEKSNPEVEQWVKQCSENRYSQLRRGIIEGCSYINSQIKKNDQFIQFRDFIKDADHEIPSTDIHNYLDSLSQLLPLKEDNKQGMLNMQYRLFLRALSHVWEEKLDPQKIKQKNGGDLRKIHDIYTFAWIMKMTRNWVSHANLLEPITPQFIAFLFLINMRAMFKLPKETQSYEIILLNCFSKNIDTPIKIEDVTKNIRYAEQDLDDILTSLNINESNGFGNQISRLHRQNIGNPDAEEHDFKCFLFQYFWVNQRAYLRNLTLDSNEFLPMLARSIYSSSFTSS